MAVGMTQLARSFIVNEARFRDEHTEPVLIWEAPRLSDGEPAWAVTRAGAVSNRPQGESLVFDVKKGADPANAFAMGITVGRASSNDIPVEDESVSRFHAFIQQDRRTGEWRLSDAESRNGTWISGERLPPNRATPLRDGSKLRFGAVEMVFLLPEGFVSWLEGRMTARH